MAPDSAQPVRDPQYSADLAGLASTHWTRQARAGGHTGTGQGDRGDRQGDYRGSGNISLPPTDLW